MPGSLDAGRQYPKGADLKGTGAGQEDGLPCLLNRNFLWQVVILRRSKSIPAKLAGLGTAMLLLCGLASAQSSGMNRARLITVSTSSSSTSTSTSRKSRKLRKRASARQKGQQKIDPVRSREIQEALIREHYMEGDASGVWDAKSESAMERFQSDNGWQSKVVPDSRALIKLGLGPDHEHLLNPESAMTSQPMSTRPSPMLNQSPAIMIPPQNQK
jgi:hypothetical protein